MGHSVIQRISKHSQAFYLLDRPPFSFCLMVGTGRLNSIEQQCLPSGNHS